MKLVRRLLAGLTVGTALAGLVSLEPALYAQGKAVEGKGTGTIKGKIKLDGAPPAAAKIKIDPAHKDANHCNMGDTEDQTWVSNNGGLGNVVVFLKPPAGSHFKVDMSKKTWDDKVEIEQPFCAFKPHVSVLFAEYEGKPVQMLVAKNNAPILHNSRVAGSNFKNPTQPSTLAPGKSAEFKLKADTQAVKVNCDAHKWMEAFVWTFNHPYAAVTKPDGTFEIKNVPTDLAGVTVWAWHEVGTPSQGQEIKKGPLKDGDTIEASIKKK